MKTFFVISLLLIGCVASPLPKPPEALTAETQTCILQCQAMHNDCIQAVRQGVGRAKLMILNQCSEKLESCYSFCR